MVDWSKVKCCGASDLDEYYCVYKATEELVHHVRNGERVAREDGEYYFFCREEFRTPGSVDLCVHCCRKLGLIW